MPHPSSPSFVVCATGFADHDLKWIQETVQSFGWQFRRELMSTVTHLVAATAGSPKHRAAWRVKGIHVVRRGWLEAYRARRNVENSENPPAEESSKMTAIREVDFLLPPMEGFSVSLSGLSREDKEVLANLLRKLGAGYAQDLSALCTHLVAIRPQGNKFDFAIANGVMVVRPDWVRDCFQAGRLLDEKDYSLSGTQPPSSLPSLNQRNASSSATTGNSFRIVASEKCPATSTIIPNIGGESGQDLLDLEDQFLSGCCIYLIGFLDSTLPHIARSLRRAGSTRLQRWSDLITHVVLADRFSANSETSKNLKQAKDRGAWLVQEAWITESLRKKAPACPRQYEVASDKLQVRQTTSSSIPGQLNMSVAPAPRTKCDPLQPWANKCWSVDDGKRSPARDDRISWWQSFASRSINRTIVHRDSHPSSVPSGLFRNEPIGNDKGQ